MASIHSPEADDALRDGWLTEADKAEQAGDPVYADVCRAEAAKPGTIGDQPVTPQPFTRP